MAVIGGLYNSPMAEDEHDVMPGKCDKVLHMCMQRIRLVKGWYLSIFWYGQIGFDLETKAMYCSSYSAFIVGINKC